ncbi:hypothetical protein B0H17DRAFT_1142072 [Mycena rosella]|uniref:PHD-type domain-containing protein n=1 Tax=Mycena rosella TaxID=1033263 RepID=A0AAD7CZF9_MYCRO|nr:hypothetical protein B0H17DRAFT_1142072 [Mycena rosella]
MFKRLYYITSARNAALWKAGPAIERAYSSFRMSSVAFKSCTGSSHDHYQVSPVIWRNECQLHKERCAKYKGNMRKWFQDLIRVTKAQPLAIGDIRDKPWNISSTLSPYASNPAASNAGVELGALHHTLPVDDLGEEIIRLRRHETQRHAIRNRATAMRGSLTGLSNSMQGVPSGYFLYAVVYHLDGGEKAQQFFRKEQIGQAQKLGLQFEMDLATKTGIPSAYKLVRPNVVRIPDDDRMWLRSPSSSVDYILSPPDSSPSKRGRQPTASPTKPRASTLSPAKGARRLKPAPTADVEIDDMLIDSITSPAPKAPVKTPRGKGPKPHSAEGTGADTERRSISPSPVFCEGCGMQQPEGDDDDNEVQCGECKLWAHMVCLPPADWDDPEVKFICKRCRVDSFVDIFKPDQILMVPSPLVPDWKAAGVLWYPAEMHASTPNTSFDG